jgi:predicted ATPase with chaperone activity
MVQQRQEQHDFADGGAPHEMIELWPAAPQTVAETGLSPVFLEDLALKTVHYAGPSTLDHIARRMGLPIPIIEEIASGLKTLGLVETVSAPGYTGQQYSTLNYCFALSTKGEIRVGDALSRSRYAGLAPVVMEPYTDLARRQSLRSKPAKPEQIQNAMKPFVLTREVHDGLARAFHSGRPALIYGDSGNGKTAIVDAYSRSFGETVLIPAALYVNGQLIRVFDPAVHERVEVNAGLRVVGSQSDANPVEERGVLNRTVKNLDRRWLAVKRPVVVVGGELTVESLELAFDSIGGFYQAPPHMKAQDGVFVIDDFGRQQMRPEQLLNRWIVPLERGYDLLTLTSGERLTVPFEASVLFSTNLSPADLADEAFLRRIPYKVRITNPNPGQLSEIARRECRRRNWPVDEAGIEMMMRMLYRPGLPEPKSVYPRDIFSIIDDGASYRGETPRLTEEALADAIRVYFVSEGIG